MTYMYVIDKANQMFVFYGYQVIFHYQSVTEPAIIKRLVSQLNKSTGEVVKNKPK